jgi:predicted phosphodiesterase
VAGAEALAGAGGPATLASMRIAVISDIHSNLRALDAVLATIGTVDAIWHLGDVVGYGPELEGVIERLGEIGAIGVKGNHDDAAVGGPTIEYFNADARLAIEWTATRLDPPAFRYLAELPERLVPEGSDFTLVHGSPRDPIWEYLASPQAAIENLTEFETPYCLCGHTHIPLVFRERAGRIQTFGVDHHSGLHLDGRRAILNPGSVGQPRDGDPRASYMTLDTAAGLAVWERVAYDIDATQVAMLAAGLPPRLARRLSLGH